MISKKKIVSNGLICCFITFFDFLVRRSITFVCCIMVALLAKELVYTVLWGVANFKKSGDLADT